jgi:uncharacterized membrane protein YfhO
VHGRSSDAAKMNNIRDIGQKWIMDGRKLNVSPYLIFFDEKTDANTDIPSITMVDDTKYEESDQYKSLDELQFNKRIYSCGKVLSGNYDNGGFAQARVEATSDCYLTFKTAYHPGWHAKVDGKEQDTSIISPCFIGVHVSPGLHDVTLEYRMPTIKGYLIAISALTLILLFIFRKKYGTMMQGPRTDEENEQDAKTIQNTPR